MTRRSRHDRTVRLLEARLETIAVAGERGRSRPPDLEPHILGVAAATRNAVALRLISVDEAGRLWADVARRHPAARWAAEAGPTPQV